MDADTHWREPREGLLLALLRRAGACRVMSAPGGEPVEPEWIVLAMLFSGVVGVFFGWYPALRASRLDPIEALRHT